MNESIAMIERVTAALGPLSKEVVFVGGAVVRLLVTDPSITEFRTTDDVDVIVEITSRGAYAEFEDQLREIGFQNVSYPGAPLCRWDIDGTIVDVMPTEERLLGFSNRWYPEAIRTAPTVALPSGSTVRIIDPVVFIATKLEAFSQRGNNDPIGSRDIEDVISVVDGRPDLPEEFRTTAAEVQTFIRQALTTLITTIGFRNAVLGYLPHDPVAQQRYTTIMQRFQTITQEHP
ncbi:MAG: hypothetical protein ACLFR8_07060 [Alkalispirochaeta sp.]